MTALFNAPVLKAELTAYHLDISDVEGAKQYANITEKLKNQGLRLMRVYSQKDRALVSGTVLLECRHLFDNQWNTTSDSPSNPDRRVFDWYESIVPNDSIRIGHFIEITDEIRQVRNDVLKCGYCGNHEWKSTEKKFCGSCLGSEYLKESELHLTRLMPVSESFAKRDELSDDERQELLPKYVQCQTESQSKRQKLEAERMLIRVHQKCNAAIEERDGYTWLIEHQIPTGNCIYYGNDKGFTFGWRSPLAEATKEQLAAKLKEFPFSYTFV